MHAVFSRWLPVSAAVLGMVCERVPSLAQAQREKLHVLCPNLPPALRAAVGSCDPASPHLVCSRSTDFDLANLTHDRRVVLCFCIAAVNVICDLSFGYVVNLARFLSHTAGAVHREDD
jgi:hypothetical protein